MYFKSLKKSKLCCSIDSCCLKEAHANTNEKGSVCSIVVALLNKFKVKTLLLLVCSCLFFVFCWHFVLKVKVKALFVVAFFIVLDSVKIYFRNGTLF